jgi:hypothetical protein
LPRWNGFAFNLSGAVFNGLFLPGIEVGRGTFLNLAECRFVGGPVDLTGVRFAGGGARWSHARPWRRVPRRRRHH